MKRFLWSVLASVLSQRSVAGWLISRAQRTPYAHLDGYMNRWWLFNPYQKLDGEIIERKGLRAWLPSVRVHEILRADEASHLHDHPWDARTIILKGGYYEITEAYDPDTNSGLHLRLAGDTRAIRFGEYHHICRVLERSCFTLFFTWEYRGTWGFLVNGQKVPWREYLSENPERSA